MIDDETRFWIAQQVADKKNTSDIQPLFRKGKEVAGKKPNVIISDGAPNFHNAYQKEFWTRKNPRTGYSYPAVSFLQLRWTIYSIAND